jgi:hypothetical protein
MDPTSLLLVIALPIAIYMFIRHRKKKKTKPIISERKNKDEI